MIFKSILISETMGIGLTNNVKNLKYENSWFVFQFRLENDTCNDESRNVYASSQVEAVARLPHLHPDVHHVHMTLVSRFSLCHWHVQERTSQMSYHGIPFPSSALP